MKKEIGVQKVEMNVDIEREVGIQRVKSNMSIKEIGDRLGIERGNAYHLIKKGVKKLTIFELWEISQVMDFDFFKLFNPISDVKVLQVRKSKIDEATSTVTFEVKYPISKAEKLGLFIKAVHELANDMDYAVV